MYLYANAVMWVNAQSTPTSTTLPIIGVAQNCLLKVFGNIDERLTISNSIESNVVPIGAKDKKRLSLRILVPFVLYPPHNSDQELLHSQKEMIAECLLAEVSAGVQNKNLTKNQIEERTKKLLKFNENIKIKKSKEKKTKTLHIILLLVVVVIGGDQVK